WLLFFFFQAEDGIRDLTVTGVQTCALPILPHPGRAQGTSIRLSLADAIARGFATSHRLAEARAREGGARAAVNSVDLTRKPIVRSEERRVGKEWRYSGWPHDVRTIR